MRKLFISIKNYIIYIIMSYDSYLVRLDPQDDGDVAYIQRLGAYYLNDNVKLLSTTEQSELREILLANNELGKSVGINGIHGERYNVVSNFPRINELNHFFNSLSNGHTDRDFFDMNMKKKSAAAVSKAEGGYRRRFSKRSQLKNASQKKL